MSVAIELARWADELEPSVEDLELAERALADTIAVATAAADSPIRRLQTDDSEVARWAALAHVLDFDDLHMESTTHISAVCVPVALSLGGGARAYLAGAGVMARLGAALGWDHYSAGWHATCTAGAPAAAACAGVALGLSAEQIATAIALAVPAAGGVQAAFGTEAKSLQVGFTADAGVRAAKLAALGATASSDAAEQWMALVGGRPGDVVLDGPAVPGGLAIKLYPCCYALQRPIAAALSLGPVAPEQIDSIEIRTPAVALTPLIHSRPATGLEAKFSLEYAVAAALLDGRADFETFSDQAVMRPLARSLVARVRVVAGAGGDGLLAGDVQITVALVDGQPALRTSLQTPPGAPARPPSAADLRAKVETCAPDDAASVAQLTWSSAASFLRSALAM